jgi:hypothetical protein
MYAVLSLSLMAFLNIVSFIILYAYWNVAWAKSFLAIPRPISMALIAAALIVGHFLFSRQIQRVRVNETNLSSSRWIALVYMLMSVVTLMYVSKFMNDH